MKLRPYPISASLELTGARKSIRVIYLSSVGLIAEVSSLLLYVGQSYMVRFRIPGHGQEIEVRVRVVKTYDKVVEVSPHTVKRMCEFHFMELADFEKQHIVAFTDAIGQK